MNTEMLRRAFREDVFLARDAAAVLGIKDISSTLSRLKATGVLERTGRGCYRFASLEKWRAIDSALALENIRSSRIERVETLSQLARKRFQSWLETGYIRQTGPRRYALQTRPSAGGLSVRRR